MYGYCGGNEVIAVGGRERGVFWLIPAVINISGSVEGQRIEGGDKGYLNCI